ncbi:MAG: class I SAM-dependent methyltransferase [Candidatus Omnitrophica bacterium]|nr:class I SAM-dependent methyltransferase [Candidatus Omnitrophota bacterium]
MKIRDSGMPEKGMWEGFFSPEKILETLGINQGVQDAVEFGCGYGTFTLPTAKIISGKLLALDIEPEMVEMTKNEAAKVGIKNLEVVVRDFMTEGTGLKTESMDYAMLFNILHLEEPVVLLREANRILKKDGRVGIVHWNYDASTPRGPSMSIRPKPEDCIKWAEIAGFYSARRYDLKPYHYGIVATK